MLVETKSVRLAVGGEGEVDVWNLLCQQASEGGLISIKEELTRQFHNYTDFLEFEAPSPVDFGSNSEIFGTVEKDAICIFASDDIGAPGYIDIILVAANEQSLSVLREALEAVAHLKESQKGTHRERMQIRQLRESLNNMSPNGKMICDEGVAAVLHNLYNPSVRTVVRSIMDVWGTESASLQIMNSYIVDGSALNEIKSDQLDTILSNDDLFEKTFIIGCDTCGSNSLEFKTEKEARATIRKATSVNCKLCREGTLGTETAFKIKAPIAQGLRQGLWLEKLVSDAFEPESSLLLTGRMVETFELDVVAILFSQIVLIECKDTSFGQNDYVNLIAKANEINADIAGVVTTQPVHENVKRLIERHGQETGREFFVIEDMMDSESISKALSRQVDKVRESFVTQVLSHGRRYSRTRRPVPRFRR